MNLVAAFFLLQDFSASKFVTFFLHKLGMKRVATFRMFFIGCPNSIFLSPLPSLRSDLIVCLGSYFIVCSEQNKRNWEVDQPMKVGLSFIKINSNQLRAQSNRKSNQLRTPIGRTDGWISGWGGYRAP